MKILVTGAKGFVGRNLCAQLNNIKEGNFGFCFFGVTTCYVTHRKTARRKTQDRSRKVRERLGCLC